MKLWSYYEGRPIAEAYPLKKLVRPEGRSAFFLTTNGTGTPALVRIIEAHFDESEILERWKTVSAIGQENLVTMRKFGKTELDGTPLVYAVMEPTEISLAELLENRTLTADETRELAHSLVSAVEALHARDLIHGQIAPENILAAGETVKLRSDCIREVVTYPDSDGPTLEQLKAEDAHALAVVLLQALTGRSSLQGSTTLLPSPFDGIIRNGLSGRWGLKEMSSALGPATPKKVEEPATQPQPAVATPSNPTVAAVSPKTAATPTTAVAPVAPGSHQQENLFAPSPAPVAGRSQPTPVSTSQPATTDNSAKFLAESLAARPETVASTPEVLHRIARPVEQTSGRARMWIAATVAVVVLVMLGWRMIRTEPASGAATQPSHLATPNPAATAAAATPNKPSASRSVGSQASAIKPQQAAPVPTPANRAYPPAVIPNAGAKTLWRVVAYTYNREDQAQQKAETIRKHHPALGAEVFSPSGRAPYLVTVGGPMSREAAVSFKAKARSQGLPRDLYTQNYSH